MLSDLERALVEQQRNLNRLNRMAADWEVRELINAPEVFNVRHYGAVGDDSTDDSTAIQAAVTAAAADDGVVYLPTGSYRISNRVELSSNITVCGDGLNNSVIKWEDSYAAGAGDALLGADSSIANVVIENLQLDGNRANISTSTILYGLRFRGLQDSVIRNVRLTAMRRRGILLDEDASANPVKNVRIENVVVDNFGAASNNNILGIQIRSNADVVVNENNIISHCVVRASTGTLGYGIVIESNNSVISDCVVQDLNASPASDSVVAFGLYKCTASVISGCTARDIDGVGYSIQNNRLGGGDTTYTNAGNTVTGNSAYNVRFGVECSGPSDVVISNNTLVGGVAIVGSGAAEGIEVNSNNLSAIHAGISITGNMISSFIGNSIWVGSDGGYMETVNISNNVIREGEKHGICVAYGVSDFIIAHNMIKNISQEGSTYSGINVGADSGDSPNDVCDEFMVLHNIVKTDAGASQPARGVHIQTETTNGQVYWPKVDNARPATARMTVAEATTIIHYRSTGAPTVSVADSSMFLRSDGGSGTTLYIRENGSWTAK